MTWHVHVDAIVMLVALMGLYLLGARWAGGRGERRERVTQIQAVLYTSGVLTLYIGAGSPLHDLSETYLFSAHMVQHMLFTLVAPPLILLGTPGWMLRPLIRHPLVRRAAFEVTRPLPAFLIFNAVILITHLPPVVDLTLREHAVHFGAHAVLVGTALLMWWPIFSPLPEELPGISPFPQLVYLFVQSLLPAVIASFLTLGSSVIYTFYAEAPSRYWGLSAHTDQVIAGLIMKLAGGALIWLVMTVIFFRWFNAENAPAVQPAWPVQWDEVEAELERMGLTKR